MSSSGGSGGGGLLVATVELDVAQLSTLHTVPTVIVAAPGADRALWPISFIAEFVPDTGCILATNPGLYYGTPTNSDIINTTSFAAIGGLTGNGPPDPEIALYRQPIQPILTPAVANKAITFGDYTADPQLIGPIATVTISDGGTGYAVNDTGIIDTDLYTGGAHYKVLTVAPVTGEALTVQITAAGDGYGAGDTCTTTAGAPQAGIGTGLELDVTAVTNLEFTLYVSVAYRTITTH